MAALNPVYTRLAETSQRLLAKYGIPMALRRTAPGGTYDPIAGVAPSTQFQDLPNMGAFQRRSLFYQVVARGVGGIQRTDNVLLQERSVVIDGTQSPQLNDMLLVPGPAMAQQLSELASGRLSMAAFRAQLTLVGETMPILDIDARNPAGIAVAYILTVRR